MQDRGHRARANTGAETFGSDYLTAEIHTKRDLVEPGSKLRLEDRAPADTSGFDGGEDHALDLSKQLDTSAYLTPHSDIVAHLVLAHQTQMHDLITLTNYKTRLALYSQAAQDKNAGTSADSPLPENIRQQFERPAEQLLRYLLFLTGKREVAEDLFQETWMRVLLRGAQYNGKARFDTWLFTIARNLVIDLSRKRQMASLDEMSEAGEDERPFEVAIDGPSPFEQFATREDRAEVAEVLLKLEPNYREVLMLRFHEEMSLEEIAGVTRAPLSTVKSRLYRGLAALKPEVEQLRLTRANGGACR